MEGWSLSYWGRCWHLHFCCGKWEWTGILNNAANDAWIFSVVGNVLVNYSFCFSVEVLSNLTVS